MQSMTGYGKGIATEGGLEVLVELRSVNNRFLEINTRLPKGLLAVDEAIRALIQKRLSRGSVDVFFSFTNTSGEGNLSVDLPLIKEYLTLAGSIESKTGIKNDITFSTLLARGLVEGKARQDSTDTLLSLAKSATTLALDGMVKMRQTEGAGIKADLLCLASDIESFARKAEKRAPLVVEDFRRRLKERITEALSGTILDEGRLITEVAFFAEKADINEELNRLFSHLSQFFVATNEEGAGRKLDFIAQEIGREINTLGSKSNDTTLTSYVVEMKNLLEKIKEQVRNAE